MEGGGGAPLGAIYTSNVMWVVGLHKKQLRQGRWGAGELCPVMVPSRYAGLLTEPVAPLRGP